MASFRVAYKMKQLARGWSYIFHLDVADMATAIAGATANYRLSTMMALHVPLTVCRSVTVAQESLGAVDPGRNAVPIPINRPGTTGTTYAAPDQITTTALLRLGGTDGHSRTLSLRGMPDEFFNWDSQSGELIPAPAMLQRLPAFLNAICGIQSNLPPNPAFVVRYRIPAIGAGLPWRDVSQLAPRGGSNNAWTTVTTVAAHGFQPGSRVLFGGKIQCSYEGLRGEFEVIEAPTPTTFTIKTAYRGTGATQDVQNVRVRQSQYAVTPILRSACGLLDVRSRDTGRVSGLPRGRRVGRSCRTL